MTEKEISSQSTPHIMLSGFENRAEKGDAVRIINNLRGIYMIDSKNSQAFLPNCTHIICKKPSRREKYLAACASGKWVLSLQYLVDSDKAGKWLREQDYQWSDIKVSDHDRLTVELYQAPKRWRNWIVVKGNKPPFVGWNVGLIMHSNFAEAFIRIVEAGGGTAYDITSSYIGPNKTYDEVKDELLTHILVTPTYQSKVWRKPGLEGIPHLRSDYLAVLLISEKPPELEKFDILMNVDSSRGATVLSHVSDGATSILATSAPKKSPSIASIDLTRTTLLSSAERNSAKSSLPAGPNSNIKGNNTAKPLPPSLIAKNSLITISTGFPQSTKDTQSPEKPPLRIFGTSHPVKLSGSTVPGATVAESSKQSSIKINPLFKKGKQPFAVPIISLGSRVKSLFTATVRANTNSEAKSRTRARLFSEEFLRNNASVMENYIKKKRRKMSYEGILDEIVHPEHCMPDDELSNHAKPFSPEGMASLEAALELGLGCSYFLGEVESLLEENMYPQPDVLYIMMKVLLLDSLEYESSMCTDGVLRKVLYLHQPQAKHVKAEKLYHKAFAAITMPDVNESSSLLMVIGEALSRANDNNWKMWTMRDPSLGVHWSFYSRVLNIATERMQRNSSNEEITLLKIRNATLLSKFLADLVVQDYQSVVLRKKYPSHSPMIKCLIADLLWPTMTGLEPWFRRPSTNLADLVSLYMRAVENSVQRENDLKPSVAGSKYERNEEILFQVTQAVLKSLSCILSTTASWCVFCDRRDKERGKRTSTRTLENELISVIASELSSKNMDVVTTALTHLPQHTALKVNVAIIQQNVSTILVADENKKFEEISLRMITSCMMKTFPSLQMDERIRNRSENNVGGNSSKEPDASHNEKAKTSESSLRTVKRNKKGETPLHVACIQNQAVTLKYLLNQPGVQPNATDHAGWTALGEACLHGHKECVEALLSLPLKPIVTKNRNLQTQDSQNAWEIDLIRCPPNGQTPLHDALGNGHLQVACLLLKKGGVRLLDMKDSRNKTPLDQCVSQAAETTILQFACNLAAKFQKNAIYSENTWHMQLMQLPPLDAYEKVLPRKLLLSATNWRERVVWLTKAVCYLVSNYMNFSGVSDAFLFIDSRDEYVAPEQDVISTADLENFATDLIYCYKWKECWNTYLNHLCRLLGEDEEDVSHVLGLCEQTPAILFLDDP